MRYIQLHTKMVRHLRFPAPPPHPPPPQKDGLVGLGDGGLGCCCGRPGVTERAGILRKPYASHKPFFLFS